jgi:hypothetical protein
MPLPDPDQLFTGQGAQQPGGGLPTPEQVFGQTEPQTGAAHDTIWSSLESGAVGIFNAGGRILDYAGSGASQQWGARPLGLDKDTEATLRKSGVINDYTDGHDSFLKAANEAFIRPAAAFVDLLARGPSTVLAGAGAGLTQTGREIEGDNQGQGKPNIVGEAFKGVGEMSYGASEGLLGPEFGDYIPGGRELIGHASQAEMVSDMAKARALGVIGEGEAGYYDAVPPTPETIQARTQAAHDAGIEPVAPQPPPPDIHALARRIDPDTFEQYDALALEREQHRATIAQLGDERANSPESLAAQDQIDTIMGRVRGVESRLTNVARDRLAAAQAALDEALRNDTPEMRQARAAFLDADFAMRDLAPDVSEAYRQAREMNPDLPFNAVEAQAEGEKPGEQAKKTEEVTAKGEVEAGEPQLTPEQEAGQRAIPVEAAQAASEGQPPNVVGEKLGEPGKVAERGTAPPEHAQSVTEAAPVETPTFGPSPTLAQATADVAEHRTARPAKDTILQAIKKLGGLKVADAEGRPTLGPDVQGALAGMEKKPRGLINNETGLTPERMHEALSEQGWFGHGDVHDEALVQALEKQARGEDVYHPDSGLAEAHARRAQLDEEMTKAGVKRSDPASVASLKLSHYREVEQRIAERMDTLKSRADQIGVAHTAATSYDELLGDILEREAIQGDATAHGTDIYERDIDAGLTQDEFERLHAEAEQQHGSGAGLIGHGADHAGAAPQSAGEFSESARGRGDGSPEAGGGAGRGSGDFGVAETGARRTRGVSATTEARALEAGLEQGFGDLPEYNQMSKADQAARVVAEMDRDWENAKAIAMGDVAPPHGVLPESFFEGVRMRAIADGDWETARMLATESRLVGEATTMGRRIAMYARYDPTDPVAAIKEVADARERAAGKNLAAAKAAETSAMREEVAKAAPTHDAVQSLIDIIRCE